MRAWVGRRSCAHLAWSLLLITNKMYGPTCGSHKDQIMLGGPNKGMRNGAIYGREVQVPLLDDWNRRSYSQRRDARTREERATEAKAKKIIWQGEHEAKMEKEGRKRGSRGSEELQA